MDTCRKRTVVFDVHRQDLLPAHPVWPLHRHPPVETAGSQQSRIEHIRAVRRRNAYNHARLRIETVELGQQLIQRLLALVVPRALELAAPLAVLRHRVNLVDEHDRGPVRYPPSLLK